MKRHPYPGLRAFRADESDLFFGREGCVDEMVDQLGAERFLAVLGPSGGGKSSLVRTGLFDALRLGFLEGAGSDWLVADSHPAGQPMCQLATALLSAVTEGEPGAEAVEAMTRRLRQGPRSIARWATEGNVPAGQNVLLLVDQFEELFRYASYSQREEADAFVALLIESAASTLFPIYVVLTMRSEYLGACSSIHELAEHISRGLYLIPRMERDACREAIEGPAGVIGFEPEPALVNRMLNDLATFVPRPEENPNDLATQLALQADQLPLMQHVLNRLWLRAAATCKGQVKLTLADYDRLGGMSGAIDEHGREIREGLSEEAQGVLEPVFRALVAGNSLATAVRQPSTIGELVALAGGAEAAVLEVVARFRAADCNFLRTSRGALERGTIVDISHESLIRQWSLLRGWLNEEIKDDAQWRRLVTRCMDKEMLAGVSLENSLTWWARSQPTAAWAARHGGKYEEVRSFLEESERAEARRERRERQLRWGGIAAAGLGMVMILLAGYSFSRAHTEKVKANAERSAANQATQAAHLAAKLAEVMEGRAGTAQGQAREAKGEAARLRMGVDETLAQRNGSDARRSLFWLRQAYAAKEEDAAASGRKADVAGAAGEDSEMAAMLAEALRRTRGQIRYFGGTRGQQEPILSAWFTPDGRWMVARGYYRQVLIWDARTGQLKAELPPAAGDITSASTSADGRLLVTTDKAGNAMVYEVPTGRKVATFVPHQGNGEPVYSAAFSGDGKLLATADFDGKVMVWAVPTKAGGEVETKPLQTLTSPEASSAVVFRVAFVPRTGDKRLLALEEVTDDDKAKRKATARVWDWEAGKEVASRKISGDYITVLAEDAEGDFVMAGAADAQVWTPRTNAHFVLNGAKGVDMAAISHNGRWIATTTGKETTLWDMESGAARVVLQGHREEINDVSFSTDDRLLATAAGDGTAKIWEVPSGHLQASVEGHGVLNAAEFVPGSDTKLMTASSDSTAVLWDVRGVYGPKEVIVPQMAGAATHAVNDVVFSPDDRLAIVSSDGGAELYDLAHHRVVGTVLRGQKAETAQFSADGRYVAVAGGKRVTVWDVGKGAPAYPALSAETKSRVYLARFSPDGRWLVTLSEENKATVWDARTGKPKFAKSLGGKFLSDANFDRASENLVVGGVDGSFAVYSVPAGEQRFIRRHANEVRRALFSHDGKRILTASLDGTAKIWDARDGRLLLTLQCGSEVHEAQFSPDDRMVATGGAKGKIGLWDARTGKRIERSFTGQGGTIFSTEFNHVDPGHRGPLLLATASDDGSVYVWDVSSGAEILALEENPSVNDATFAHHDPFALAVASGDGRATVWRIPASTETMEQMAAAAAAPRLAPDEATKQLWMQELVVAADTSHGNAQSGVKDASGNLPGTAGKMDTSGGVPQAPRTGGTTGGKGKRP